MKHILILILVLLISCDSNLVKTSNLQQAVKTELCIGDNLIIPRIISEVQNKSILILGEIHYTNEHPDFVTKLIDSLYNYGFKIFLIESLPHSTSWIVEDFINGKSKSVPFVFDAFDSCYIHKIREINQKILRPDEKIAFRYIDLNHDPNVFFYTLNEMPSIIKNSSLFNQIELFTPDSKEYIQELLKISKLIKADSLNYISLWNTIWFDRVKFVVEDEVTSSRFRVANDDLKDSIREAFIIKNISSEIRKYSHRKTILNVGGWHAQKKVLYKPFNSNTLTYYLKNSHSVYSIKFTGFKGKYRDNGSNKLKLFNIKETADKRDLSNIILTIADDRLSFLPLSDNLFKTELRFTDIHTKFDSIPLGLAYDALIAYPEISFNSALIKVFNMIDK